MKVAAMLVASILMSLVLWIAWNCRDTTAYAPGFSDAKFRTVSIGDSRARVIQALGQPLSVEPIPIQDPYFPGGSLCWYTKMREIKGEYFRYFILDRNGNVVEPRAGRIGHYSGFPWEQRPDSFLEWLEWYVF